MRVQDFSFRSKNIKKKKKSKLTIKSTYKLRQRLDYRL